MIGADELEFSGRFTCLYAVSFDLLDEFCAGFGR